MAWVDSWAHQEAHDAWCAYSLSRRLLRAVLVGVWSEMRIHTNLFSM